MSNLSISKPMIVLILESDLTRVIYAVQDLLSGLASYTTSVLIMVKNLLSVLYAAVGLARVATATIIRSAVGVRGSRSTRNA